MKRTVLIGFISVGALLVWTISHWWAPVFGQTASMQTPHIGEGGLPQFQLDPSFPKVPAKWKVANASAVAVDADNNVWILSRPRTLAQPTMKSETPDLTSTPAPAVMEFDNDGNFIRGWGGESGPGYQWPSNEHGITVDYRGFVWIVGNAYNNKVNNPGGLPNDNQILKFTKDGKFVMAIGKSGQNGSNATEVLRGATGLHVYPKTNELFASDGYGNSRVMVYDADTGQFKRMWGAYGNRPLDIEARPPVPSTESNPFCTMVCGMWSYLQQFSVVHDVAVSSDGLVYVSDRGNKRVQVFTTDGKFMAEQFVGLDNYFEQARGAAFSPDERFLYVGGMAPLIWILNRRTLEVLGAFDFASAHGEPLGHQIAADHKGNIYASDLKSGGVGTYRFAFKGYSPKTPCPPCQSTRNVSE